MSKSKTDEEKPTEHMNFVPEQAVTRTAKFWAHDMAQLAKLAQAAGKTEWDEVRFLIRERVSGNVIVLTGWRPELRLELDRKAEEMGLASEEFAKRVLSDYLAESMQARKKNKR